MMVGAYRLRSAIKDQDHERLARFIEADADHRGRVKPEYFYNREPGIESYAIEDASGNVVYFRITRCLRIDVQFGPSETPAQRAAIRDTLMDGFAWLIGQASRSGIRQIIFDSVSRPLIAFCKRRFRFEASPNEFVCPIPAPKPEQSPQGDGNQVHQPSQREG